jgi:hypothetical protein
VGASAGGFDAPKQDFDFGWCAADTHLRERDTQTREIKREDERGNVCKHRSCSNVCHHAIYMMRTSTPWMQ